MCIFSGVNAHPTTYGFDQATNIAGVREEAHSVQTIRFLKEVVPSIKKVAVISDDGATWPAVIEQLKDKSELELRDIEFVAWDIVKTYKEYQSKIFEYQTTADAILHLGVFTFLDENNENAPYEDVMKIIDVQETITQAF